MRQLGSSFQIMNCLRIRVVIDMRIETMEEALEHIDWLVEQIEKRDATIDLLLKEIYGDDDD